MIFCPFEVLVIRELLEDMLHRPPFYVGVGGGGVGGHFWFAWVSAMFWDIRDECYW